MNIVKVIFCMFFLVCFSCQNKMDESEDEDEYEDCQSDPDDNVNIIGKWMVVITKDYPADFFKKSCKYSKTDVVYEFKTNGIMTVSRESDYESVPYGREKGDYEFSITEEENVYSETGFSMALKFGYLYYGYGISCNKLEINSLPLDGDVTYLIRID